MQTPESEPKNTTQLILLDFINTLLLDNNRNLTHQSSLLDCEFSKTRINHVLVYHGSFNPPHIGHLSFLQDAFNNTGRDMPFVCAVIMPAADSYLSDHKFKDLDNALVLPSSVRAGLWATDARLPSWAAVLDPTTSRRTAPEFLAKIKIFGDSLGYRIKYWMLWDADWFGRLDQQSTGVDSVVDNLVFYAYETGLDGRRNEPPWQTWGVNKRPWEMVSSDKLTAVKRFQKPWINARTRAIRGHVRVVCALGQARHAISSTEIRRLSTRHAGDELQRCSRLREMGLSWDLLQCDQTWMTWHGTERQKGKEQMDGSQPGHVCEFTDTGPT
ncbi:hypothetical protein B0H66DRAFT_270507 [Apodospora peruviana]|uniref:Cytidyltransferase-like domain-containing protein n=1 Tax=Apodospora peruviana TaxID=516989 RepID=A0AAE0HZF3_9PEZI|nr:hypothetical protein B0H66DRAFT_270507 [Apodospora peruviana]